MNAVSGWLCAGLLWLIAGGAQGALQLRLDDSGLSPGERQASQLLIEQALAALPPSFIQRLDKTISVQWSAQLPAEVYGRASQAGNLLELNAQLLPKLLDGSAASTLTGRSHSTVQQELLASLLHELTHFYDRAQLWPTATARLLQSCRLRAASQGLVGLPSTCRGQTARRFSLSDDPRLLDLAGWPQYVGRYGQREQHNAQVARSPDPYELSNPREFVAVNLEYFLLDPSYACRRPELYAYWQTHFGWAPKTKQACATQLAYLNAGSDFARQPLGKLDPERVYAVDFLLAEGNNNWVSRFGHSMLRLVICAPGRPRGPACRLDLDQHLVLSYRAFVGDVQLSSWEGLTGGYPSRLFVLPLSQVIDEYTKLELRSVASVPLKLSPAEQDALVKHALEMHWSYDGDYFFLSNNCAVETLKLLRSGSAQPQLEDLDSIMPNGLLAVLEARGLADTSVLDDPREALRLGYRFDSFRERYQAMFVVLKQHLPIPQEEVEDWLELAAKQRSAWFAQADLRTSAALLLLEQAAMRRQLLLAQEQIKQRYLSDRGAPSHDPALAKAGAALQQLLANSGFLSRPAELLGTQGYGLPQPDEWQQLQDSSANRQQLLRRLNDSLSQELRALLGPAQVLEIETAEANLGTLGKHLRELHKASGGLQLP
ncbi:MAG: DUF4105 domain-containing protein [Pseudomonadaceae bacterium]|nr:DUF4105 domain-containing protein [Pseudomonadaceae bacterium]